MNITTTNIKRALCWLTLMLPCLSLQAAESSWELIILSAYDPSVGGKVITIKKPNADGIYKIRMEAPTYFSWRDVDGDGQHPSASQKNLDLFLNAWNMLYENKWANAEMVLSDYASQKRRRVAIKMGPPRLSSDHKTLEFKAKFKAKPSSLLASISDSPELAVLAKSMPVGRFQGMNTLWVENATQTPHDLLSKGIRFTTRKVKVPADGVDIAATQTVLNTASTNLIKPSGDCTAENVTKQWVLDYVSARPDVQSLKSSTADWGRHLNDSEKLAIARAYMLPCEPKVGDTDTNVPVNVQLVKSILTRAKWDDLTTQLGSGEIGNLSTAELATYSYENFLRMVGKYPFFCGEQGIYSSLEETCRRELASIFAHAAQETGAHDKTLSIPEWKQAFSKVFEGSCYTAKNCKQYNPDTASCPVGYSCPADYYGRGIKQISYFYNYMGFSGQMLGDPQTLLTDPDAAAKNGLLGLGSGLWFHMSPQPPKPSMHDVLTGGGGYHPTGPAGGVSVVSESYTDWTGTLQTAGNPEDKFMVTISLINGGRECSPEIFIGKVKDPNTGALYTKDDTDAMRQLGINRMMYYSNLLTYFGASKTSQEVDYGTASLASTAVNGCNVDNGNPFAADTLVHNPPVIAYTPLWWVTKQKGETACSIVSWQPLAPFSIASESSLPICEQGL